jgi:pyridoxamine 5'-phosphate oxidase
LTPLGARSYTGLRRYRLGVRTDGSQPSDRGSNPRSATSLNPSDPIAQFEALFARARASEPGDVTKVALATADVSGAPSLRMVLLKGVDERGFVFFTNHESRKARDLAANARAALCFYWETIGTQVRVEGSATRVSDQESDAYFATRPRDSQIGAWASRQSAPVASREELLAQVAAMRERFAGQAVSRPPFWGGYLIAPERIEFWSAGEFRLHDRILYTRAGALWRSERLFP